MIKCVSQVSVFVVLAFSTLAIYSGCTAFQKVKAVDMHPVNKAQLVLSPFTYEPTIQNFNANLKPYYKLQVYSVKNRLNPSQTDTIYRFYRKKSELFIYKAYERELFIAGNIYDDKVVLRNGIKVGIKRDEFLKCFKDLPESKKDTIRLTSKKAINSFYFIFHNDKLKAIKIDNYFD